MSEVLGLSSNRIISITSPINLIKLFLLVIFAYCNKSLGCMARTFLARLRENEWLGSLVGSPAKKRSTNILAMCNLHHARSRLSYLRTEYRVSIRGTPYAWIKIYGSADCYRTSWSINEWILECASARIVLKYHPLHLYCKFSFWNTTWNLDFAKIRRQFRVCLLIRSGLL